jgi:hypothetical protein
MVIIYQKNRTSISRTRQRPEDPPVIVAAAIVIPPRIAPLGHTPRIIARATVVEAGGASSRRYPVVVVPAARLHPLARTGAPAERQIRRRRQHRVIWAPTVARSRTRTSSGIGVSFLHASVGRVRIRASATHRRPRAPAKFLPPGAVWAALHVRVRELDFHSLGGVLVKGLPIHLLDCSLARLL